MKVFANPYRDNGLPQSAELQSGEIVTDPDFAHKLFNRCPIAKSTPLLELPTVANELGLTGLSIKDERRRMGLGSFKALGAAFSIAKAASKFSDNNPGVELANALTGVTYVCASAGNHGLSMAAGARLFGARAVVYLSASVPEEFAQRLQAKGAEVRRHGETYEQSMAAAMEAASANTWKLLSDSSWLDYSEPARDVMEGYLIMADEAANQIAQAPSHIFLQAGVGGLAAACAASARNHWGNKPVICVVEPEFAPALMNSIEAGKPVVADGPISAMGRLDCKEPSHLALQYLAKKADFFLTISDSEAADTVALLCRHGLATSPSGAAGLAGLAAAKDFTATLKLNADSRALIYVSEGAVDVDDAS